MVRTDTYSINRFGHVAGHSTHQHGGGLATVATDDTLVALIDLVPPQEGLVLSTAFAIADDGRITVQGVLDGTASFRLTPVAAPGDATFDCLVNWNDLRTILTDWGACDDCTSDLTNDGTVGLADLLLVLDHWSG